MRLTMRLAGRPSVRPGARQGMRAVRSRSALPLFVLPALVASAGCTTPPAPEAEPSGECREPRPQVCTMIYAPVCAEHADARFETHSSNCNACADDTVVRYTDGACQDGVLP